MKQINYHKIFLPAGILLLMLIGLSCTEIVDIELNSADVRLVVDGSITTDSPTQIVKLTTTSDYFQNQPPPVVSGALVKILDEDVEIIMVETPSGSGIYKNQNDFYGVEDKTYRLEITLKEPVGGKIDYEAVTKMPVTRASIDSIVLEYQQLMKFWAVNLYANDPLTTDFYKIDAMRNGVMITDTATRSSITDDLFFNGNNTNGLSVMFLYNDEVNPGDTLTFILSSIPKDYYDFFRELQLESGASNPLFGGPPANISTNIQPEGLGFFTAQNRKRYTVIVKDE
ncbi:MAG: DUF4249 domain-containing protein [Bacteroidales bacterium]|nr:DUF4249 domain-containing protein [Bacteroidales bacterium]